MRQASGVPVNVDSPILARVTKTPRWFFSRKGYVLAGDSSCGNGYSAKLSSGPLQQNESGLQNLARTFIENDLQDKDIVLISPDGHVSVVWENNSHQNCLLLTEACDCQCLMCPQVPKKKDPGTLKLARKIIKLLKPNEVSSLCLTGGEPSLLKDKFVSFIELIVKKFPRTRVTLLTNGKNFSDFSFAKSCAIAAKNRVEFCISLHADNDIDHDRIVGVPGSFMKTVRGITNLARLGAPIEIRFVVNKINVDRMVEFSDFCYRNFPFAIHITFMAMEIRGLAEKNIQDVWIDPAHYGEKVRVAVRRLAMRGLNTSIYNMPLCLLPQNAWPFARQSISGWKNDFLGVCDGCDVRQRCAGIFTSSCRQSEFLSPVKL